MVLSANAEGQDGISNVFQSGVFDKVSYDKCAWDPKTSINSRKLIIINRKEGLGLLFLKKIYKRLDLVLEKNYNANMLVLKTN